MITVLMELSNRLIQFIPGLKAWTMITRIEHAKNALVLAAAQEIRSAIERLTKENRLLKEEVNQYKILEIRRRDMTRRAVWYCPKCNEQTNPCAAGILNVCSLCYGNTHNVADLAVAKRAFRELLALKTERDSIAAERDGLQDQVKTLLSPSWSK